MKEFKSKNNISDYVIPMKVARPVFHVSESLKCLLLNEQIKIENEYSWLCNPHETKVSCSLSCTWKSEVSTFKWTNSNKKTNISD